MRIEKPFNGLYQAKLAQNLVESASGVLSNQIGAVNNSLVSSSGILSNQIVITNAELAASSASLQSQIDIIGNYVRIRRVNALGAATFSTTSPSAVFLTGSNVTIYKKYSSTQLRVIVTISIQADKYNSSVSHESVILGALSCSIDGGSTWIEDTVLRYSGPDKTDVTSSQTYSICFLLGTPSSGNIDFRLGLRRDSSFTPVDSYINAYPSYSYLIIEALENA